MNPRVTHVSYQSPHKLLLTFSNQEQKAFDLKPFLQYPVFQPLQDEARCQKAKVCLGTVAWMMRLIWIRIRCFLNLISYKVIEGSTLLK